MEVLQAIMGVVESHRLRFRKDPEFWDLLIQT